MSIQKTNDVFTSVYRKDFVYSGRVPRAKSCKYEDTNYEMSPEKKKEFLKVEYKIDVKKMDDYIKQMKELDRIRLQTTYRADYVDLTGKQVANIGNMDPRVFSPEMDETLIQGKLMYAKPTSPVLPPVYTFRKVFGYSDYDWYRTDLSTYADVHGRVGYNRMKELADNGYCRMGPKYDYKEEISKVQRILKRESDIERGKDIIVDDSAPSAIDKNVE